MINEIEEEINVLTPNPLLAALRIPGETFRLPSHGLFYDDKVLDASVKNGEVEVYPMTAIDEIIINTQDKLLSGKAISEVFARCIPQIKQPHKILAKDVDFLLVCLRMVSFGQFMEVVYTHQCKGAKQHNYMVDIQEMIKQTKSIDPVSLTEEYVCKLDNGQVVYLKPMTYGDIILLYQDAIMTKTDDDQSEDDEEEAKQMMINTLSSVISRVDNVTDVNFIKEWLSGLKLGYKKQIQQAVSKLGDWGIEMTSKQICGDCGEDLTLHISANPVNLFT